MKIIHFETIDSTNNYIKKNYESIDHLSWVTASIQTSGKGRSSKTWYGDSNSLLASILIKNEINPNWIHLIPLLAAKSLHQVLFKYHQDILIKWPNDLLIHHKKIAGILVESISLSNDFKAIIIGFGINLNQKLFPSDLYGISTSLYKETNQTFDQREMLELLHNQITLDYEAFKKESLEVISYCNKYLAYKDQLISYLHDSKTHHAYVKEIDHNGHLIVMENDLLIPLNSGEITFTK